MGRFIRGKMACLVHPVGMALTVHRGRLPLQADGLSLGMDRMVSPESPVVGAAVEAVEVPWEAFPMIYCASRSTMAIRIALAAAVAVVARVAKAVPAVKAAVGGAAPSLSSSGIMARMGSFGTVLSP